MFYPIFIQLSKDGPHAVLTLLRCEDKWLVGIGQLQHGCAAELGLQFLKSLLLFVLPLPGGFLLQMELKCLTNFR